MGQTPGDATPSPLGGDEGPRLDANQIPPFSPGKTSLALVRGVRSMAID